MSSQPPSPPTPITVPMVSKKSDSIMVKMVITAAIARDYNNEVGQMTKDYPTRFARLCTLPMQDVRVTIAELERGVVQ